MMMAVLAGSQARVSSLIVNVAGSLGPDMRDRAWRMSGLAEAGGVGSAPGPPICQIPPAMIAIDPRTVAHRIIRIGASSGCQWCVAQQALNIAGVRFYRPTGRITTGDKARGSAVSSLQQLHEDLAFI